MNELGTLLRKLRNDSKKTLEVIHEQTGITDSRLRRIERGLNESGPSFEILMQLAKCYNANLIDLYSLTKREDCLMIACSSKFRTNLPFPNSAFWHADSKMSLHFFTASSSRE